MLPRLRKILAIVLVLGGSVALWATGPGDWGETAEPSAGNGAEALSAEEPGEPGAGERLKTVYILPVKDQIGRPIHYILRRGMKEAAAQGIDLVVLDMDTPGGRLNVTLDIMEMMARFEGDTATFVNPDAISAGAFIAASTKNIYFSPRGVMGAAAPVTATGDDIPTAMKQKLLSFLTARIRSFTEEVPYRTEVLTAMVDADFELIIDDEVISPEGSLLSLTASEAVREFGDPPHPLLAQGIYPDIQSLLDARFGVGNYEIKEFHVTWSEHVTQYLSAIAPILIALGLIMLYMEAQSPGFGVFGMIGVAALGLVFLGNYAAGLAGYEPVLFFLLGLILIAVEVFFFPGTFVFAISGVLLVIGSLIYGMADIWPDEGFSFSPDVLVGPALNVFAGIILAVVLGILFARFMPRAWFLDRLILSSAVTGSSQSGGAFFPMGEPAVDDASRSPSVPAGKPEVGARGRATSDLYPGGEVEIDGKRYQARAEIGMVKSGRDVEVTGYGDFLLIVREIS